MHNHQPADKHEFAVFAVFANARKHMFWIVSLTAPRIPPGQNLKFGVPIMDY